MEPEPKYPSLSQDDFETMLGHLDASMIILRQFPKAPFDVLKIKSALSVLRDELTQAAVALAGRRQASFTD